MEYKAEIKNEVVKCFFTTKTLDYFLYLYDRWQDEKLYEDWNDYTLAMKSFLERNGNSQGCLENVKGLKRPFGLKFTYKGFDFKIHLVLKGKFANLRMITL